jgi:hypothetical protein
MNDSTRARRLRRPWPPAARTAVAVVAMLVLAPLAAACGGPSSAPPAGSPTTAGSTGGSSTASPSAVAYSACMRSHGVPSYPDPNSSGQLPKGDAQEFGVSASTYQTAQQDCQSLMPAASSNTQQDYQCLEESDCSPAVVQQMLTADRKLAQCMRTHGWPNFPDPTTDSSGPIFNISAAGISDAESHSTGFENKLTQCANLVGDNAPESFE